MSASTSLGPLADSLGLEFPAVAVTFLADPPDGIPREQTEALSGCTFWKWAADGRTFYTRAEDHYGCPVGSHTHGIDLPEEKAAEAKALIETMVGLEYIKHEEVASLPRREGRFGVAVYAPLAQTPLEPDLVLVRGTSRQLMLLFEACQAVGLGSPLATMGRPTCAIIPETLQTGRVTLSLGCIGNRVYTELADAELYCSIPGASIEGVIAKVDTIMKANAALEEFHRSR